MTDWIINLINTDFTARVLRAVKKAQKNGMHITCRFRSDYIGAIIKAVVTADDGMTGVISSDIRVIRDFLKNL